MGCDQLGVPGEADLRRKNVGDVGEMARSKIDNGDAGRRGEATVKMLVVMRCGSGGERKGLCGDWGEESGIGEVGR